MSIPTDLPYCFVYPSSYMKDVEPDHFDTHNNPTETCLHCCICHATLQHMNDDPCHCREYGRSHLILPCGAQYKEQLFPKILKLWNHQAPLTDLVTKEPFPMELVGDFRSRDPIFKGCYGNSFLYSDMDPGARRYTFLPTRVKSWPHWLLPTCKPSSLRPRSSPHCGLQCQTQLWNLARPNALAARAGITVAQDVAPTHQPQSAPTLPQPRSLPILKSQP